MSKLNVDAVHRAIGQMMKQMGRRHMYVYVRTRRCSSLSSCGFLSSPSSCTLDFANGVSDDLTLFLCRLLNVKLPCSLTFFTQFVRPPWPGPSGSHSFVADHVGPRPWRPSQKLKEKIGCPIKHAPNTSQTRPKHAPNDPFLNYGVV